MDCTDLRRVSVYKQRIFWSLAMAAMVLMAVSQTLAQEKPLYPMGTVTMDLTAAGAGIGAMWGSGKLRFEGGEYPFSVKGLRVAAVGISKVSAVGNVYNLTKASDLAGNYAAVGAGIALAGGVGGLTMRNDKGVLINLYTTQTGLQLNLGPEGFSITMK